MPAPERGAVSVERLADDATAARAEVVRIGKRSFPALQSLLLHETPHVFAATHDGEIVGGTISEVFEPTPERTVGLVTWIFTDADAGGPVRASSYSNGRSRTSRTSAASMWSPSSAGRTRVRTS
jgi:hypothetical protein